MNLENKTLIKLIDLMPYGIMIVDLNNDFLYCNKISRHLFEDEINLNPEDRWKDDFGIYNIDKKTKYNLDKTPVSRALLGETIIEEKFFIKSIKNKEGIFVKISCYPVYNKDEVECAVLVFDDITKDELNIESIMNKIVALEKYLKDTLNIGYEDINIS